ncbi:MAG TPA: GAP family protein [Acidimicrobiales bacterium]|nr:GAP family protein [Acidimicrobiales bacterium]
MKAVIGELLPLAIAVTISPVPIIAEILLLFTKKPVANAASYLVGFTVGVAGLLGLLVAIAGTVNLSAGSGPSRGASILRLVLGAFLLMAATRRFRDRPKPGDDAPMPRWMEGIAAFAPGKSFAVGVAIGALNPKNVVVGLAAALSIASAGLSTGQQISAVGVYAFVAILGVAAPLVVTLALREKAQEVLDGWRSWLGRNNGVVLAVLFLIFGVVLIGKGIAGL